MYWPLIVASFGLGMCAGTIGHVYPDLAWMSPFLAYGGGAAIILGLRLKLPDDFPARHS